ncbi:mechanosensitive ion channel family protein [Phormidium sp. CLA17]|uniref:mechanosensitive ion channel family protein n=1 Tax=Leptolyngbya sp. Cla-17 TaxID=2803751 RepID=UPI0019318330|nr:mechanosensitive ion channel family protein [Leptolyngbya sp. Cla-17]MBM0740088.1 mechanosensitive ion channel family protein [Leptolyngbya sp. Cla-17]
MKRVQVKTTMNSKAILPKMRRLLFLAFLACSVAILLLSPLSDRAISTGLSTNLSMGQLPLPSFPATLDAANKPPAGVQRYGAIEVASVVLDEQELFKVASPTVLDRKNPGQQVPVEVRANQVEANLKRVIVQDQPQDIQKKRGYSTRFDPKTLQVSLVKVRGETVIVATDNYRTQRLSLLTVTNLDAEYYGLSIEDLAKQWHTTLSTELNAKLQDRLPEKSEKRIQAATTAGLLALCASLLLWLIQRSLERQDKRLKAQQARGQQDILTKIEPSATTTPPTSSTVQPTKQLEAGRSPLVLSHRHLLNIFRWLLGWGQVAVYLLGLAAILSYFPQTNRLSADLLGIPTLLLLIWLLMVLANWIGEILIDRFALAWETDQLRAFQIFEFDDLQRKSLRISTAITALRGLKTFAVWTMGGALALQVFGIPIGSVLTGGALVAFGVSLAFQNLIKDLINGCLILWEDQYGLGDTISISGTTGLVESMNLRVTQIRDVEGRLITIPNSSIIKVENLTRTWSRVNFDLQIDYETDVDKAIAIVDEVAQQLYAEPEWSDRILEAPKVLGVENLSHIDMTIRTWIKTKPSEQWNIGREFRRRIRRALAKNNIQVGIPQQIHADTLALENSAHHQPVEESPQDTLDASFKKP